MSETCPRCGSSDTSHNSFHLEYGEHHYGCRKCWNTWAVRATKKEIARHMPYTERHAEVDAEIARLLAAEDWTTDVLVEMMETDPDDFRLTAALALSGDVRAKTAVALILTEAARKSAVAKFGDPDIEVEEHPAASASWAIDRDNAAVINAGATI